MSSRYDQRYRHRSRETKGHGCLGFFLTLIIVGLIVGGIFFFMTGDRMDGFKGKVYSVFYPQKYSEQVSRYSSSTTDPPMAPLPSCRNMRGATVA